MFIEYWPVDEEIEIKPIQEDQPTAYQLALAEGFQMLSNEYEG